MAGYQLTVIEGNLGRDPELRYTPSSKAITQFSVAVSRSWKQDGGEWQEETTWFRVIVWGEQGERLMEKVRKGSKVIVQGRIQTRTYRKEGSDIDVNTWELVADRVVTLDPRERDEGDGTEEHPRRSRRQQSSSRPARERTPASTEPTDDLSDLDDLPFS